jgi:hypothetical protein
LEQLLVLMLATISTKSTKQYQYKQRDQIIHACEFRTVLQDVFQQHIMNHM